jgi:hypothetical protein
MSKTIFLFNPNIQFIKVNQFNDDSDKTNRHISEWHGIPNIKYMNFLELDRDLEFWYIGSINNNDSDYTANTNTIIRRKYNGL